MAERQFNISVENDRPEQFSQTVRALKKAGLKVEHELPLSGTVVGTAQDKQHAELEQIAGVRAVESARIFQLPPPESDLQ